MASFLPKLWESIFTPGTTPTLLIATNAAFASLELLLIGLLAATFSIHFLVLSILAGGLWWAINWFARELAAAEAAEAEAKRIRAAKNNEAAGKRGAGSGEVDWGAEGGDEKEAGDETETETEVLRNRPAGTGQTLLKPQAKEATGASVADSQGISKRKSLIDAGELSTDSEWEKVDD